MSFDLTDLEESIHCFIEKPENKKILDNFFNPDDTSGETKTRRALFHTILSCCNNSGPKENEIRFIYSSQREKLILLHLVSIYLKKYNNNFSLESLPGVNTMLETNQKLSLVNKIALIKNFLCKNCLATYGSLFFIYIDSRNKSDISDFYLAGVPDLKINRSIKINEYENKGYLININYGKRRVFKDLDYEYKNRIIEKLQDSKMPSIKEMLRTKYSSVAEIKNELNKNHDLIFPFFKFNNNDLTLYPTNIYSHSFLGEDDELNLSVSAFCTYSKKERIKNRKERRKNRREELKKRQLKLTPLVKE